MKLENICELAYGLAHTRSQNASRFRNGHFLCRLPVYVGDRNDMIKSLATNSGGGDGGGGGGGKDDDAASRAEFPVALVCLPLNRRRRNKADVATRICFICPPPRRTPSESHR